MSWIVRGDEGLGGRIIDITRLYRYASLVLRDGEDVNSKNSVTYLTFKKGLAWRNT